jgi:hypothetical protein
MRSETWLPVQCATVLLFACQHVAILSSEVSYRVQDGAFLLTHQLTTAKRFTCCFADGDGHLSWQDMRLAYNAVDKSSARFVVSFEDLMNQIRDMVEQQQQPQRGFTCAELRASKLGPGVLGLLTNHNNMLLQRSTAEWGRGEYPL